MTTITEAEAETAALDWLRALGWQVAHGPDIAPDTPSAERDEYGNVVLERRLRDALAELNFQPSRVGAGGRLPQAHPPGRRDLGNTQPRLPPDARRRRDGGASGQ